MQNRHALLFPFALLATSLLAQQCPATESTTFYPARPKPGAILGPELKKIPLVVPLFIEGRHFSSTLTLVNNATVSTYADVTLRSLDGSKIAARRVNFMPHSQQRVEIGELLVDNGAPVIVGSILVAQSSALLGPSIAAALQMAYLGSAAPNYIDEEIFMPISIGSRVLQGVSDRADEHPVLAISSLTGAVQHVRIEYLGKDGTIAALQVKLAGGETRLIKACAADAREY